MARRPRWRRLYTRALRWEYGDVHSHDEISRIIGIPAQTTYYYQVVSMAKKRLIKEGKIIKAIHNEGYKVLLPDEYPAESVMMFQKGSHVMEMSKEILDFAPVALMSEPAQQQRGIVLIRITNVNKYLENKKREIRIMLNRVAQALMPASNER